MSVAVMIAIVMPTIGLIAVSGLLYGCRKSRKLAKNPPESGPYGREYEKWVRKLELEISLRLKQ